MRQRTERIIFQICLKGARYERIKREKFVGLAEARLTELLIHYSSWVICQILVLMSIHKKDIDQMFKAIEDAMADTPK